MPEQVQSYRNGELPIKRMKDKIMATRQEATCASAPKQFTSLVDPADGIGGGQHGVVSTLL